MDVIGTIEPKALNRHRFILVAIAYLTKWVEAITLKAVTKKAVVEFVHSNIICLFGIPATIIKDNAAKLNTHLMRQICEQFKITHRNFTLYRPKANDVIEATNKNIKKILRKMIKSSRKWNEKLPFALLEYRTTEAKGKFAPNWKRPYNIRKLLPKGALYLGDIERNDSETAVNANAVKRNDPGAIGGGMCKIRAKTDENRERAYFTTTGGAQPYLWRQKQNQNITAPWRAPGASQGASDMNVLQILPGHGYFGARPTQHV
uniref:Integrase catalytic domain-containing protein n=1 Tax=Nicotiana tabacum TaxID=4097 RepID=A0A1S3ZGW5_TOBAC|nr:PREDICTED: uncharacterized protein LOC107786568 [Nicotiana tabacum]